VKGVGKSAVTATIHSADNCIVSQDEPEKKVALTREK
jgi:hypothetical protein